MARTWLDVLEAHSRNTPQRIAMTLRDHEISYTQYFELVKRTTRLLRQLGVRAGDRVALLSPARPEAMLTFLACCEIGAVWVSLNPKYKEGEIEYVIDHAQPSIVISVDKFDGVEYVDQFARINERSGRQRMMAFFDPSAPSPEAMFQSLERLTRDAGDAARPSPENNASVSQNTACMLVYTSGTTGKPKGVLLSQSASVYRAHVQAGYFKTKDVPVIINFSAINHVGGMQFRSAAILAAGGTICFQERFKPAETLALIREKKVNILMQGPTLLQLLVRDESFDTDIFQQLEWYISAGAALPLASLKQISQHCANVATVYGATETSATLSYASLSDSFDSVAYSIGWPATEGEMRVADESGQVLGVEEPGELQVEGTHCMLGYLNDPDATKEAYTQDGWLKTGDHAVLQSDGSFRIIGRIKEMFKSGGYNVYPREIEIMLETHPAIKMAAVVPVDDPLYQQVGHAFVLLHDRCNESETDLIAWCKERLANYKVPKRIHVESELPMLPIGKIDKVRLRELAAAEMSAG